jgi:UPF0042 nucleotide-binding protein
MAQGPIKLIIITGMSGAGKTVAIQSLEDLGFFCVDNLPPTIIPKFIELLQQAENSVDKVALVIDMRGRGFFADLDQSLKKLDETENFRYQILFLDANDQVLVQRYKETRRSHPMNPGGLPLEGIQKERRMLADLKGRAHQLIDTSFYKARELKEKITSLYGYLESQRIFVHFVSFGFKYGVPIDADLVFDVRFLPNPHYVDDLRPLTGQDSAVYEYVMKWSDTQQFLAKLEDFLKFLIPHYEREGKSQVVIAIGCTGGKHRSVAVAEYLVNHIRPQSPVKVSHRDIEKDR